MTARKKIVVTGGSGRVGRYVLAELASDHDVVNADLVPASLGPKGSKAPEVDFIHCDVMDLDAVRRAVAGADTVIHLAAIDFDWKASDEKYIRVNALGTWHVLQAARELNVEKVVLCSSISISGLSEMRHEWTPQFLPVDETHENQPVQAYSVSKDMMESMGLATSRGSDLSVICIRPLAVVLEENLEEFTQFIDNPELRWLYYYIEASDLAQAFRAAVEVEGIKFDSFYISADDTCHPAPTLDWYPRVIGQQVPQQTTDSYERNPRASIFSSAKAKEKLGWNPTSNFLELRETNNLPLPLNSGH